MHNQISRMRSPAATCLGGVPSRHLPDRSPTNSSVSQVLPPPYKETIAELVVALGVEFLHKLPLSTLIAALESVEGQPLKSATNPSAPTPSAAGSVKVAFGGFMALDVLLLLLDYSGILPSGVGGATEEELRPIPPARKTIVGSLIEACRLIRDS